MSNAWAVAVDLRAARSEAGTQLHKADRSTSIPGGERGQASENKTSMLVAVQVTDDGQQGLSKLRVLERCRKVEVERSPGRTSSPGPR